MSSTQQDHAIVIGGSITGLCTAEVLRRRFRRVTVIERDVLPDAAEPRAGVPQGRQLHLLLRRGLDLLEGLFPRLSEELEEGGAEWLRWGGDIRWYHFGGWKRPNDSTFSSLFSSRLLMEAVLRQRLRASRGVEILDGTTIDGLTGNEARVRGVKASGRGEIDADLVVDASGRESKALGWLRALGAEVPAEREVNAKLGYSTRIFRRPERRPAWRGLIIHATPPDSTRLGAILPMEGNRWQVVLAGVNADYPPTDEAGFLAFTQSLAEPDVAEALAEAEPVSPIWGYRRTANKLRRYDRLARPAARFVALGDAVCAFNPVYAQGMTTGTIGASLLGEALDESSLDALGPAFQKRLQRALLVPWFLATSEDYRYPETEGRAMNAGIRAAQAFVDRVIRRSCVDVRAYDAFLSVMHMTRGLDALVSPRVLASALAAAPETPAPRPAVPRAAPEPEGRASAA